MANVKLRILLVGKHTARLRLSEQALNRLGYYRIAATTSAMEAVSLARCLLTPFDVLIVDHDIVQPSGLDLIERCQQQKLVKHFILSGNPSALLKVRARERCSTLLGTLSAPMETAGFCPLLSKIDPTLATYNISTNTIYPHRVGE